MILLYPWALILKNQIEDNFDGVYNVEYFTNENLVEIPRNIKPERYSIIHTTKIISYQ